MGCGEQQERGCVTPAIHGPLTQQCWPLEGVLKRNTLLGGQHHFLMGLKLLLAWGLRPKAWVLWEPL